MTCARKIIATFSTSNNILQSCYYLAGQDMTQKTPLNDSGVFEVIASAGGLPTYFSLTAQNRVGLTSTVSAPVVVVDNTPPTEGELVCPEATSATSLTCTWSGVRDQESGLQSYWFGIGTNKGLDNVINFTAIHKDESSIHFTSKRLEVLTHNKVYYATLVAFNNVDLRSQIYSNDMKVDYTP